GLLSAAPLGLDALGKPGTRGCTPGYCLPPHWGWMLWANPVPGVAPLAIVCRPIGAGRSGWSRYQLVNTPLTPLAIVCRPVGARKYGGHHLGVIGLLVLQALLAKGVQHEVGVAVRVAGSGMWTDVGD